LLSVLLLVHAWRCRYLPADALAWRRMFVAVWLLSFALALAALLEWTGIPPLASFSVGFVVPLAWGLVFGPPLAIVEGASLAQGIVATYYFNHLKNVVAAGRSEFVLKSGPKDRWEDTRPAGLRVLVVDPQSSCEWIDTSSVGSLESVGPPFEPAPGADPLGVVQVRLGDARPDYLYTFRFDQVRSADRVPELLSFPTGLAVLPAYAAQICPAPSRKARRDVLVQAERERFFLELARLLVEAQRDVSASERAKVTVQRLSVTTNREGTMTFRKEDSFVPSTRFARRNEVYDLNARLAPR